jgi:antitoxin ParD1/3/4
MRGMTMKKQDKINGVQKSGRKETFISVSMGEYQSASDYFRDLIKHDLEETERLLVEGVESGTARPLDMVELKKRAQTLLNQGKRSR